MMLNKISDISCETDFSKAQEARNKFGTFKKKMKIKKRRYYTFLFVWDTSNDNNMTS